MLPFDLTISTGKLVLTEWPPKNADSGFFSYKGANISGSFHLRINGSGTPCCLIEIQWSTDEEFHFSNFTLPFVLFFQFENSLKLKVSQSGTRTLHERSSQLMSMENRQLILSIKKDIAYRFVAIPVSFDMLAESVDTTPDSYEVATWPEDHFFYPRSPVIDQNGLEMISFVFFGNLALFERVEIVRALVRWFLVRRDHGVFQPEHITMADAQWFYEQKLKLLSIALKPVSLQRMIEISGLNNKELFKIRLRQLYGISIPHLILESRMVAATSFLKNPELTIKQIAGSCGYHGVNYFTRVFSHYFGISPNAFRKLL